jgi:hypothetical protein
MNKILAKKFVRQKMRTLKRKGKLGDDEKSFLFVFSEFFDG